MMFMIQFTACGYLRRNLMIQLSHNQGISQIETLENEIDKLKKELDQVTLIKHDLNPSTQKEIRLRVQYDNSENEKKFESSFELLRKRLCPAEALGNT